VGVYAKHDPRGPVQGREAISRGDRFFNDDRQPFGLAKGADRGQVTKRLIKRPRAERVHARSKLWSKVSKQFAGVGFSGHGLSNQRGGAWGWSRPSGTMAA